jgi:putative ABC transport system substrate-binding protein
MAVSANAQQPKVHRVGLIVIGDWLPALSDGKGAEPVSPFARAFTHGLRKHGFIEDRNLILDWRMLNHERFEEIAADVVRLKPDVVFLMAGRYVLRFRKVNTTIPVVSIVGGAEIVGTEWIKSFARPGGNITGMTTMVDVGIEQKRLELLLEIVPKASRIAFLGTQLGWEFPWARDALTRAGQPRGVTVFHLPVAEGGSWVEPFAVIERERPDAVFVARELAASEYATQMAQLALKSGMPMACPSGAFVTRGCLMSYGPDFVAMFGRLAEYVARILKGAKPGDLPIEQPTKFELIVNQKTARAIGVEIPKSVLLRADRVIE